MADGDSDDRFLVEYRLRKAGVWKPLVAFRDGDELLKFLETTEGQRFCLLQLDLNMSLVDGFEVIEWLHERPQFRGLSIVVITSSTRPSDREKAMEQGVSQYWEKFPSEADLSDIVERASRHRALDGEI